MYSIFVAILFAESTPDKRGLTVHFVMTRGSIFVILFCCLDFIHRKESICAWILWAGFHIGFEELISISVEFHSETWCVTWTTYSLKVNI